MDNSYKPAPVVGSQCLHGSEAAPGCSVEDFWRWRYANLMDDDNKGAFAEWLVATLFALPTPPGGFISGDNFDLMAGALKIEVKSSAYWQSWKLIDLVNRRWRSKDEVAGRTLAKKLTPKAIRFAGLYARQVDEATPSPEAAFKADLYIFAFQNETDPYRWDALNLDQWEFYALERDVLIKAKAERDSQYKTIPPKGFALSLPQLRMLCGRPIDQKGLSADELRAWGRVHLSHQP